MAIMTHAKFHFNRLMFTLIFGIRTSEPPPPPPGPGFSLGLDDMEGDLSPPIWGGTSTGGQSSNRGGRMGRDIYFMGGDPYFE